MSCKSTFRVVKNPFEVNHEVAPEASRVRSELVQHELDQVEEYLPGSAANRSCSIQLRCRKQSGGIQRN